MNSHFIRPILIISMYREESSSVIHNTIYSESEIFLGHHVLILQDRLQAFIGTGVSYDR